MILVALACVGAGVLVLFAVACLDVWLVVLRDRARLARLDLRALWFRWRGRLAATRWALRDRPWDALPPYPDAFWWPRLRWQLHYLACGSVDALHRSCAACAAHRPWRVLRALMLPQPGRHAYVLPTHRDWWAGLWWRWIEGRVWRALALLGLWEVAPAARYRAGRWRWRFWATPRSYWTLRRAPQRYAGGWWGYVWRGW
jgi:hypothetical protein